MARLGERLFMSLWPSGEAAKDCESRLALVSAHHLPEAALSESVESLLLFLQRTALASPPPGLVRNEVRKEK